MTTLEIAVTTLEDAITAERGGADSIEISIELERGGLTPPLALVEQIVDALTIDVHVIVRPHDRDFDYTQDEFRQILADTEKLAALDVAGIVFGAHHPDRRMNTDLLQQVVEAASGKQVTVHRALDSCTDHLEALHKIADMTNRVLTSGPAETAWQGRYVLRKWQEQFGNQIDFIAAGSIRVNMLPELVVSTGVSGIHVGSAAKRSGKVDVALVRELRSWLTAPR